MAYYSSATPAAVALLSLILLIITITGGGGLSVAADICPAVGPGFCHQSSFNGSNTQEDVFKTLHKSTHSQCQLVSYNDVVFQITVWRFAWCGLGDAACKTCFNKAVRLIRERCPYRQGASFRLPEGCCVRYEIYDFCSDPGHS